MSAGPHHDARPAARERGGSPLDTELGVYVRDIGREPLLSPAEVIALAGTIQGAARESRASALLFPDACRLLLRGGRVTATEEAAARLALIEESWERYRAGTVSSAAYRQLLEANAAALEQMINPSTVRMVHALRDEIVSAAREVGEEARRLAAVTGSFATAEIRAWEDAHLLPLSEAISLVERIESVQHEAAPAKDRLWRSNLRLVVTVGMELRGRGLSLSDLISHGNEGLLRAVELFDGERGIRFSSYATWWIKQAMLRGLEEDRGLVYIPAHAHRALAQLDRTMSQEFAEDGRPITAEEAAAKLGWTDRESLYLRAAPRRVASLDTPLGEADSDFALGRLVAADDDVFATVAEREDRTRLADLLVRVLDPRQRTILSLFSGIHLEGTEGDVSYTDQPRTVEAVGAALGITRQRVDQILKRVQGAIRNVVFLEQAPPAAVELARRVLLPGQDILIEAALTSARGLTPELLENRSVQRIDRQVPPTRSGSQSRLFHLFHEALDRFAGQVIVDQLSAKERTALLARFETEEQRTIFERFWLMGVPSDSGIEHLADALGHPLARPLTESRIRSVSARVQAWVVRPRVDAALRSTRPGA